LGTGIGSPGGTLPLGGTRAGGISPGRDKLSMRYKVVTLSAGEKR
jgi:hypothetical protein